MFSPPKWPRMTDEDLAMMRKADPALRQGPMYHQFSEAFAAFCDTSGQENPKEKLYVLPVANGTVSLELILKALGIQRGDEVILPAYTFVATLSSIAYTGALPVLADIEPDTYNLSPEDCQRKITPRTKAIVAVAVAGRPFDLDAMEEIAKRHHLPLIVDAAQAVGALWQGRSIASYGLCASFSCQNTKNLTCGEGGIITTADGAFYEKLSALLKEEPGTALGEVSCALLLSQLRSLPEQMEQRAHASSYLNHHLKDSRLVQPLFQDPRITLDACHLYVLRTRYRELAEAGFSRADLIREASALGLPLSGGYQPLYDLPSVRSERTTRLVGGQIDLTPLPNCRIASYEEGLWLEQFWLLAEDRELDEILVVFAQLERRFFG